jgi:hypothetical protein
VSIPFDPYDIFGYVAAGLLLMIGLDLIVGFPHVVGADLKLVDGTIVLLAAYIAGQLVAGPSRFLLETVVVGRLLQRPNVNLLRTKRPWVRWLLFPGYFEALPKPTVERIMDKARAAGITEPGEALFVHIRFADDTLSNERLMRQLDSFVNKYGFSRNLAFTCLALAIAFVVKNHLAPSPELVKYGVAAAVGSVLLFYRYLKFFRQYSYELFNTFAGGK